MEETSFEIAIDIYGVFEVVCFIEIDSPWSFDLLAAALAI